MASQSRSLRLLRASRATPSLPDFGLAVPEKVWNVSQHCNLCFHSSVSLRTGLALMEGAQVGYWQAMQNSIGPEPLPDGNGGIGHRSCAEHDAFKLPYAFSDWTRHRSDLRNHEYEDSIL